MVRSVRCSDVFKHILCLLYVLVPVAARPTPPTHPTFSNHTSTEPQRNHKVSLGTEKGHKHERFDAESIYKACSSRCSMFRGVSKSLSFLSVPKPFGNKKGHKSLCVICSQHFSALFMCVLKSPLLKRVLRIAFRCFS